MKEGSFELIVLGCTGGPNDTNLSGYLLSPVEKNEWIALDAGTLLSGIQCALKKNSLPNTLFTESTLTPEGEFLTKHLKAYLISHAHLDHIAGLVFNSQIDTSKPILGIDPTIDNVRDHLFNGKIWANFGNEGFHPLNLYRYMRLPLHQKVRIPRTRMNVEAFLLSHPNGYPSTAFLIESEGDYILYFGDTSADVMESEKHNTRIWYHVAPLIRENRLKGILLECSFSQKEQQQRTVSHLDPTLFMAEMAALSTIADVPLQGLKVIVTHRKESIRSGRDIKDVIAEELLSLNNLNLDLLFPVQGVKILL